MVAGSIALGVMMVPIIARTTEELLRLVPPTLREGALALGATRGRAMLTVMLPAALPGIVTGVILALARVAGETAPLLFTAFSNRFWNTHQPAAANRVAHGADFHLRQLAVRRLASAGMGWSAGARVAGLVLLAARARRHTAPRADEHRRLGSKITFHFSLSKTPTGHVTPVPPWPQ
jgi:ABC-type phosphate transport system permease subunit